MGEEKKGQRKGEERRTPSPEGRMGVNEGKREGSRALRKR